MKLRNTWFLSAMARILASASTSVMASGSASGAADLMLAGTMASVSASSESWPTTRSMCAISASFGPMWRSRKAEWCSRSRREAPERAARGAAFEVMERASSGAAWPQEGRCDPSSRVE
jgi:membrane-bound ClpP family serine protease